MHQVESLLCFSQLAFQSQRTLHAGLAAGDGYIVKALSRGGEKESVRVFQGKRFCQIRIRGDETITQFGQNHFQRTAKAIEHPDAVFQTDYAHPAVLRILRVAGKGELRLRIVGMNQKGGPSVDIALQQPHALMRGVPAGDHDVVQLVAQKSIDYGFVFGVHFEKIRQRADRGQAAT